MAEDNQTGADGQQEPEQHAPTPKDVNGAKPRTFTQEEVDRIVNERLGRERGRKGDYEELKEKAGQTADLESKLSKALEENERLRSEAEQAEHERELSAIRANVAAGHGITDPGVLAGDDERQIGEHAERLMKVFADMRSRGPWPSRARAPDRRVRGDRAARTSPTPCASSGSCPCPRSRDGAGSTARAAPRRSGPSPRAGRRGPAPNRAS